MHYIGVPEMMGDVPGSKYKTAPLRDVASHASYMHNGIFRNLDEVLLFYESDRGADAEAPRLQITPAQKADLLEFLRSLSGQDLFGRRAGGDLSVRYRQGLRHPMTPVIASGLSPGVDWLGIE
jgi:hypothetical protein